MLERKTCFAGYLQITTLASITLLLSSSAQSQTTDSVPRRELIVKQLGNYRDIKFFCADDLANPSFIGLTDDVMEIGRCATILVSSDRVVRAGSLFIDVSRISMGRFQLGTTECANLTGSPKVIFVGNFQNILQFKWRIKLAHFGGSPVVFEIDLNAAARVAERPFVCGAAPEAAVHDDRPVDPKFDWEGTVATIPEGASVNGDDGATIGTTNCKINLKLHLHTKNHIVLRKTGFKNEVVPLTARTAKMLSITLEPINRP